MGKTVKTTEKKIKVESEAATNEPVVAEATANENVEEKTAKEKREKKEAKKALAQVEIQEREIIKQALEARYILVKEHLEKAKENKKAAKAHYKEVRKNAADEKSSEVVIAEFNLQEAKIHQKEHKRLLKRIKERMDSVDK